MSLFAWWGIGLAVVLIGMTLLWLVSVRLKDASIIDGAWGLGFVVVGWIYARGGVDLGLAQWILLSAVTIWGLRLSIYIAWRNHGHAEDRRYAAMRAHRGESFWWQSLFRIFWLQGVLIAVISVPLLVGLGRGRSGWTWLDLLGLAAWTLGFGFEVVGDAQLARFKADVANAGKVLQRGLWRFTRHPNYFGEAAMWWGYFLLASSTEGAWWTFVGPLIMTFFLLRVSGVSLLEKDIAERRPAYRDYVERTNAFLPWFPKRARADD